MSRNHVAIAFSNGMGNFIFLSAALKVLRNWGYDNITLITDEKLLRQPFMVEVFDGLFENIVTECDIEAYDRIFVSHWFIPACLRDVMDRIDPRYKIINWHQQGIHEVQLYLEMIGASWKDFDGYLLEPADEPILRSERPRIALANCSVTNQAEKKRWKGFPELSETLNDMGYTVILLGLGDELKGCTGVNYLDQLTVKQSAKVLQQCDLLISVSTGLSLVADAVATPVLLIEGPMPTFKAHPVISKYSVVRKYISCAPCFQKPTWKLCETPVCMDNIAVGDVIQGMLKFMPHLKRKSYDWSASKPPQLKSDRVEADGKVCYLMAVCNRVDQLEACLDSFKASYPQKGHIIFVNDASDDPRVDNLLQAFKIKGISKTIVSISSKEKIEVLRKYPKTGFSKPVYNRLIDQALELDEKKRFDYVILIDSDFIVRPYWTQRCINIWEETKDLGVATVSGFNAWHFRYDKKGSEKVFESSAGSYRIRNGNNLPYLMSMDSLKHIHGKYDLESLTGSSDIDKSNEINKKNFKSVVVVPSQAEHWGAFETSFVGRGNPSLMSEDFV